MVLNPESPNEEDLDDQKFLEIYQEATDLYGLLHSRYIQTPKGLSMMKEKILNGVFGVCPRLLCGGQNVMPIGMSELLKHSRVKVYCPKCEDVYIPKKKCEDIDGAYFGPSFPFILTKTHTDLMSKEKPKQFVPNIYGFKLFKQKGSIFAEQEVLKLNGAKTQKEEKGIVESKKLGK